MRHVLTVSGGASSPDSDDESTRASQRRKPPADEGHPALPDGAVVPLAPVRESHHRVEALAWNSDDGGARETPPATSHDDRSADEGRSCCVTRLGGRQRLRAFTGELGLDLLVASPRKANLSRKPASNLGVFCCTLGSLRRTPQPTLF